MRILTVGNMYPPHHQGGYELMWKAVVERARARGHVVRVLVSDHREPDVVVPDDPDARRVLRLYWNWEQGQFLQLGVRGRVNLERSNAAHLERELADFRPDVVSWWSMGCLSLGLTERVRRRGLPASFAVHDDWLVYGPKADQWMRIWRDRRRLVAPLAERLLGLPTSFDPPSAGRLVFNSAYMRGRAAESGIDVSAARVLHPGIDERFLAPAAESAWRWRLLCVGRLDRQKGVDVAVAALAALPEEASLTVVGTGDRGYLAQLRDQAHELGVLARVHFVGFKDPAGVRDAYACSDAVLFPVLWDEPFGLVPLEAMGSGRAVVSTASGGSVEYLRDEENALLVPSGDPRAMAVAIERLAGDPTLRAVLRAGGLRTSAAYSIDGFAEAMVDEIERAA